MQKVASGASGWTKVSLAFPNQAAPVVASLARELGKSKLLVAAPKGGAEGLDMTPRDV